MNSFKRLYVSIKSQIDHVADGLENHEALANAALQDVQDIARKTRLHLQRVERMTEHHQLRLQEQQEQARLWSERAVKVRQEDESKALQCVRRLRQAQRQIEVLERQIHEAMAQKAKIRDDLDLIQEQMLTLKSKKEILVARQNRAGLQEALFDRESDTLQQVQHIFERWEDSVVGSEFDTSETYSCDGFAEEFERQEEEQALKKILDELSATNHSPTNQ